MYVLINLLYLVILFSFCLVSVFIVYHIVKYSINKKASRIMLFVFIPTIIFLIILNISLFTSIDVEDLFRF